MACGGCRKSGGKRHGNSNAGDLSRYAFLSPRQLRRLKSLEPPKEETEVPSEEDKTEEGQE